MAGPDLRRATAKVEALMDDTCTVVRDSDGREGTLDEETGKIVGPGAQAQVYSGRCLLTLKSDEDAVPDALDAYADADGSRYRGLIPLSAAPVLPGDVLTVQTSRRDPQLVGRRFVVDSLGQAGTYVVARVVGLTSL